MSTMADVKNAIEAAWSKAWTTLWPAIKLFMTQEGQAILTVCEQLVVQVAQSMLNSPGSVKKDAVAQQAVTMLAKQNVSPVANVLNMAIEIAYNAYLSKKK